jgi:hypothetical protein
MVVETNMETTDSTSESITDFIRELESSRNQIFCDRSRGVGLHDEVQQLHGFRSLGRGTTQRLMTQRFSFDNDELLETTNERRFVNEPPGVADDDDYREYKLCADFSDIREFLDIVDRDEECVINQTSIHSVENRENFYNTEIVFGSFSDRVYLQALIEMCNCPENMALSVMKSEDNNY